MPAKPAFTSAGQDSVREGRDGAPGERRRYAPRMAPAERREQLVDAALEVILEQGYGGVSIEAIARRAGVTRPVVYDHFPNLGTLLHTLVKREERISLEQLEQIVPADLGDRDPIEVLADGVRRFLEAVASRPATWRIILLPLEGTPEVVREHVETNRARTQERIANIVRWALQRQELPDDLDVELTARAIRVLSEDAGRTLLTDPKSYPPERYERFVRQVLALLLPLSS
ncbi:MAG TPA: TetR/AcrR family transcriptional regulator [Solirubrobacteraceae bacterium]|nr:TetR/AcrR family transcriptional regulator [Solirubrobacteraceae bacterium]